MGLVSRIRQYQWPGRGEGGGGGGGRREAGEAGIITMTRLTRQHDKYPNL